MRLQRRGRGQRPRRPGRFDGTFSRGYVGSTVCMEELRLAIRLNNAEISAYVGEVGFEKLYFGSHAVRVLVWHR